MSFDARVSQESKHTLQPTRPEDTVVAERSRSVLGERLLARLDRAFPKKPPEYSSSAKEVVDALKGNKDVLSGTDYSLGTAVEVILTAVEPRVSRDDRKSPFERQDDRRSLDVILHPLELTVLLKALYYIAKAVEDQPIALQAILSVNSFIREQGEGRTSFTLLSTLEKLNLLEHPSFTMLASTLRREILTKFRIKDIDYLTRTFKGRLIDKRKFWEEGFASIHDLNFPDNEALLSQRRNIAQDEKELRQLTVTQSVRASAVPRYRTKGEIARAYKDKPQKKREIASHVDQMIQGEIRNWRGVLQPFTERIGTTDDQGDYKYLLEAIETLARHFTIQTRRVADSDLSQKAKKIFPEVQSGKADQIYFRKISEYLAQAVNDGEPLITWLFAFRNSTSNFLLERAIQQDPQRFVDLEKLILHQLSKYGLLRLEGEEDLILRKETSADNKALLEDLSYFLYEMRGLAARYPKVNFEQSVDYDQLAKSIQEAGAQLLSPDDNPLMEVMTEEYLQGIANDSARERFNQFVDNQASRLDWAFFSIRMRSKVYRRLLASQWWNGLDLSTFIYGLRMEFDHRKKSEHEGLATEEFGGMAYSSERMSNYDDLPFIPMSYDDDLIRNFLIEATGHQITGTGENEVLEPQPLERILRKGREVAKEGYLYIVKGKDNVVPLFSGHTFRGAWKLEGKDQWLVATKKYNLTTHSSGVTDSVTRRSAYEPYLASDVFDFEKAKEYSEKLSNNPELQEIYRNFIYALKEANLSKYDKFRQIVLVHLEHLQAYIQTQRYYDIRDDKPDHNEDAFQHIADNPEHGFECYMAARVAKAFLESVGVKASVLSGEKPYFYKGIIVTNDQATRHDICVAIFPKGEAVEIDLTPPITHKTPQEVKNIFLKTPHPGEGIQTIFEKQNFKLKKSAALKIAMAMLLLGTSLAGIKAAVLPNLGFVPLPFMNIGSGEEDGDGSETEEADPGFHIDFSTVEWQKILLLLAGIGVSSVSFLRAYDKIERKKRRNRWEELSKNFLEKKFNPSQQVLLAASIYTVQHETRNSEEMFTELRRVNRLIKNFDWDAARPLIEAVAFRLHEGSERSQEILATCIAESQYREAYDAVAEQLYENQPAKKGLGLKLLTHRLVHRQPLVLAEMINRGKQIVQSEIAGTRSSLPEVESDSPQFVLFCRSMDMLKVILDFKNAVEMQIKAFEISRDIEKNNTGSSSVSVLVSDRANEAAWRMKSKIMDTIRQIERSMGKDATQLLTPAELAEIKAQLDTSSKQ